jgi:Na+/glutamate symporter
MNMTGTHLLFFVPVGLVALVVGVVVRLVWRRARTAATRPIVIGRSGGSPLYTLLVAALVIGAQWAVAANDPNPRVLLAVLAVPALFAGTAVARLMSGSTTVRSGRKGARR